MRSNRFNPSITLADEVLEEICIATKKEIVSLDNQLKKSDQKGNREKSKIIVELLFAAISRLEEFRYMQKNLDKRSRQGRSFELEIARSELV